MRFLNTIEFAYNAGWSVAQRFLAVICLVDFLSVPSFCSLKTLHFIFVIHPKFLTTTFECSRNFAFEQYRGPGNHGPLAHA